MVIRTLTNSAEDYKQFLPVIQEFRPTHLTYEQFKAVFLHRHFHGNHTFVAVVNDRIVGSASVVLEEKFIHDGGIVGHIEDVIVCKDYRHQGIGEELVKHCSKFAQERGAYKVILDCDPTLE